jgi:hypothetical protein
VPGKKFWEFNASANAWNLVGDAWNLVGKKILEIMEAKCV